MPNYTSKSGYPEIGGGAMTEIFVFGSNLAGRHGKGAALSAKLNHGAKQWQGDGIQGHSYAIPTKDRVLQTLPLYQVANHIGRFIEFAIAHPELRFRVTPVGCGLAGYRREQIRPLFEKNGPLPPNCFYSPEWDEADQN
jgi:hypothetical protein